MRLFHLNPSTAARSFPRAPACLTRSWLARGVLLAFLAAGPSFAVNRTLKITPPTAVVAGAKVSVSVYASTDAGGGEHIGFFHGEFSTDGGKTWTAFCFEQKLGPTATRIASFTAGSTGSKALVRVRVAYRGGKAGDVDFNGAPINWGETWANWGEPPAKVASLTVGAH
jgi:hypothetical protein